MTNEKKPAVDFIKLILNDIFIENIIKEIDIQASKYMKTPWQKKRCHGQGLLNVYRSLLKNVFL